MLAPPVVLEKCESLPYLTEEDSKNSVIAQLISMYDLCSYRHSILVDEYKSQTKEKAPK